MTTTTTLETTTTFPDTDTCPNLLISPEDRTGRKNFEEWTLYDDAELLQAYGREHTDTFGGLRFVHDPTRLEITFKSDVTERCIEVRDLVTHVDALDVVVVPSSFDDKLAAAQVAAGMGASVGAPDWGPVRVRLPAFAEDLARQLHDEYGDLFEIQVGPWPYPPPPEPIDVCPPINSDPAPEHVTATAVAQSSPIDATTESWVVVTLANAGGDTLDVSYGNQGVGLFQPGSDRQRSVFAGSITMEAILTAIPPGESIEVRVRIGLTPCTLDDGYLLPPGSYEIRGPISVNIDGENHMLEFAPIPIEVAAPPPVSLPPREAPVNTAPPTTIGG